MDHLKLTVDLLSVDDITNLVADDSCGAISLFIGTTRDNFEGKKVVRLEYEAYEPMALKAMKSICDEIRNKWPTIHGIAIFHRLGNVPCKEASVVIAVSSPHRKDSLEAVAMCIDSLKASVPIWKKEVYESADAVWKENVECSDVKKELSPIPAEAIDKNLVQITVSNEELQKRIQNFIERKRAQVNKSNIRDFTPGGESETEDAETCARVRTQFVKRHDSKGHLKIRKVYNEWGPQTVPKEHHIEEKDESNLPHSISERVVAIEKFLHTKSVSPDIYKRLKDMEDKIEYLQSISPEYAQFWKNKKHEDILEEPAASLDCLYSVDDIDKKIELIEMQQDMLFYNTVTDKVKK